MIVTTTESILRWRALISAKLTFIIDIIIIIIMMSIVGVKVLYMLYMALLWLPQLHIVLFQGEGHSK